jgi:transposase
VIGQQNQTEESELNATTVALGLANSVFDLAMADSNWKIMERTRLTHSRLARGSAIVKLHWP